MQMVQDTLRDVLKKQLASFRPVDPPKLCNCRPRTFFFKTFWVWACFWHSLKDFKVGVAHPCGEIGTLELATDAQLTVS